MRLSILAAALLLPSAAATAAPFNATTGQVDLTPAAFAIGFETTTGTAAIELFARRNMALTPEQIAQHVVTGTTGVGAIEGTKLLVFGAGVTSGRLRLDRLPSLASFAGHRVEFTFWQRPYGTRASATLNWIAGDLDSQNFSILGTVPFQPSGRGTDDGWEEWTSGPVDFSLAGMVAPVTLSFRDAQFGGFGGFGSRDQTSFVWLDAFAVEDLGPAAVPAVRCTLPAEQHLCGRAGACEFGRCVDAAAAVGPKFENPMLRAEYVARRTFEYSHLEGGRAPIARMDAFAQALAGLAGETSTVRFWNGLASAVQALGDGHASPPTTGSPVPFSAGVCIHLGDADLLPGVAKAPLVFTTRGGTIGDMLQRGDALVSMDGRTVSEWTARASRFFTTFGDPEAALLTHTPDLFSAAITTGAVLEFQRPLCAPTSTTAAAEGAPVTPCPPDQVTTVRIDLGEMEQGLWSGDIPTWLGVQDVQCDFRFDPAFPSPDGAQYEFAGTLDDADNIRTLQINGVPGNNTQGGQVWYDTVTSAFLIPPEKMVLDERLGDGGTIDAVDHLAAYLVGAQDFDFIAMFPQLRQDFSENLLTALANCPLDPLGLDGGCGDFIGWRLGENHPGHGQARETKLAVLIGLDVSGNDYLTKLLTYRRRGTTRIFGGAPTLGAYGVIWSMAAVPGETSGGSIQVLDTIFRASSTDLNAIFCTSTGVPPDVQMLEKQSDAVRGADTLMEAAKAWLKQ